jgi:Transposase family tnp2
VPTANLNLGIEAPESAGSSSRHFEDYIPNVATGEHPQDTQGSRDAGAGEDIIPDPLRRENEDTDLAINLLDLQTTQKFLDRLRTASLEDTAMDPEDISTLRNPEAGFDLLEPSPLLRSIQHFINNASASRDHYDGIRDIEGRHNPNDPMLSFDQVKRRVRWLSGVVPIEHDMCPNSCVAYTGPYDELDRCPQCTTPRYFPETGKPQKRFSTIPIGPVIQALYGSHELAEHMHYLEKRLAENLAYARAHSGKLSKYDDTACGTELLVAWESGRFGSSDIALQFSINGAQLRPDQPSEAWVFIWVIHNLPPSMRYKKDFVIPGAIVPGPNKPRELDSFLFPSLSHVAALQREGLKIYDASTDTLIPRSIPCIVFATADSLGSAAMSGMVGHGGRYGCRLYCDMPGRRRDGDSHYYPVMALPHSYDIPGCSHPDISSGDLHSYRSELPRKYTENLRHLLAANSQAEYRARRLQVGLCKQTLFHGLPHQPLPVPSVFTMDIMHLSVLNDPDLILKLFLGKLDVYDPDDRENWDWAIFYRKLALWNAHGETVARAVPFLPSSFGRAPRDPAKKLNTGYKAWEFQQYIYGLGPALFRHLLPEKYWINFCKLVSGIRTLQRHCISHEDLLAGHKLLMDFIQEFEELYYQRMESRIHFVRQSIHLLSHIAPETLRLGPLSCYAQWTLETAIGNLGREIRQDRDLYANLTQRAIIRAQVNSLRARFPSVKIELKKQDVLDLSNRTCTFDSAPGYKLLPRREEVPTALSNDEHHALMVYWNEQRWLNGELWPNAVRRWAKLQLPNEQKARSVWFESSVSIKLRRTSCVEVFYPIFTSLLAAYTTVKIKYHDQLRIANVQFYFFMRFGENRYPLAMVSLFSLPDDAVLSASSNTVYLCDALVGREGLAVVPITDIYSVVAMIPDMIASQDGSITHTGKFSLMRHAYVGLAPFTSGDQFDDENDNDEDSIEYVNVS